MFFKCSLTVSAERMRVRLGLGRLAEKEVRIVESGFQVSGFR
jgi:hypothetical protein